MLVTYDDRKRLVPKPVVVSLYRNLIDCLPVELVRFEGYEIRDWKQECWVFMSGPKAGRSLIEGDKIGRGLEYLIRATYWDILKTANRMFLVGDKYAGWRAGRDRAVKRRVPVSKCDEPEQVSANALEVSEVLGLLQARTQQFVEAKTEGKSDRALLAEGWTQTEINDARQDAAKHFHLTPEMQDVYARRRRKGSLSCRNNNKEGTA
jgi:hypothetical protein